MKIELVKLDKDEATRKGPGARAIVVDGERRGTVTMRSIGAHGVVYEFLDAHGHTVQRPSYIDGNGRQRYEDVKVYGDKVARRGWGSKKPDLRPLNERLLEAVTSMVADGQLKPKAELDAELEAANARAREVAHQHEQEKLDLFGAKADEVLKPVTLKGFWTVPELRERIIEAMKWAQSQ